LGRRGAAFCSQPARPAPATRVATGMEGNIETAAVGPVFTALVGILYAIPLGRVFHRAGFAWGWALFALVPVLGPFVCWLLLAARRWPWRRAP